MNREEAENASELEGVAVAGSSTGVSRPGVDALSVQTNRINKTIRSFADAYVPLALFICQTLPDWFPWDSRRSDIVNERLPELDAHGPGIFPVPSMRRSSDGMNMEEVIKRTLEEDDDEGGVVEKIADRIARGRSIASRPGGLKRHGTAY